MYIHCLSVVAWNCWTAALGGWILVIESRGDYELNIVLNTPSIVRKQNSITGLFYTVYI